MSLSATEAYRKTPKGVLTNMYSHMKRRNKVEFTLPEFHAMYLNDKKFIRLHDEWIKSGCKKAKKPSIDRINNKKHYSVDNIHMLTWEENRFKQTMERRSRKGAVAQLSNGRLICIFKSQREAAIKTKIHQGNISSALTGDREKAGGYEWRYINENPDLLSDKR